MNKLLLILTLTVFTFHSCTKEDNPPTPPIEKTPEELLIAHSWKIQELRWLDQGILYHYQRGIPGNGDIVANEAIQFNADKTGKTHDNTPLTWEFMDAAKTKLKFTINFPTGPVIVNWEHMVIKESSLTYAEFWTRPTGPSVGFGTRIPL